MATSIAGSHSYRNWTAHFDVVMRHEQRAGDT
jgi:hypothetical protein